MVLVREFVARLAVLVAIVAATIALGIWWTSLIAIRTAGTLNTSVASSLGRDITSQLDRLAPASAKAPGVASSIDQLLKNPQITQALANSTPNGSKLLTQDIAKLNTGLGSALSGKTLTIDVGQHGLASLARHLRSVAKAALILAIVAAAIALVLSPLRHIVLRHLAMAASAVGALAVLGSWLLPALVGHYTHGGIHNVTTTILSGGNPVRTVVLECLIAGAAVYFATHLFELVGGRRVAYDSSVAPLAKGELV